MGDCQSKNKVSAVSEPTKEIGVDVRVPVKSSGNQATAAIKDSGIQTDPKKDPIKEKAPKPENGRSGQLKEMSNPNHCIYISHLLWVTCNLHLWIQGQMREVISIHIGQAGVQIGNSCWELFCLGESFKNWTIL